MIDHVTLRVSDFEASKALGNDRTLRVIAIRPSPKLDGDAVLVVEPA